MTEAGNKSRRTVVALFAALVVSAAGVASADAGFKSGRFVGTTSADTSISFKATKTKVKRLAYALPLECDDGSAWSATVSRAKTGLTKNGEFTLRSAEGDATSVIAGKLRRRKGAGTIATAAMNPNGASCSGSVEWTARRK